MLTVEMPHLGALLWTLFGDELLQEDHARRLYRAAARGLGALEWVRTGDFEEWLRLQQEAAARSSGTAGPSAQDARGRDSPHGRAQPNLRLSSRLDGADRDERLANTGSSDCPVADAFHPDVRERAAQQTHEVAIGDASTSGQRSSGRARDEVLERASVFHQLDVPNLSSFEACAGGTRR